MADVDGQRLLMALQLADSFFPTGMYAHSQGLESMTFRRWVSSPDGVEQYLRNLLVWAVLPSDGVALLNAHAAAEDGDLTELTCIDWHLHAMKMPEEMRVASCHAGRRILDETDPLLDDTGQTTVYTGFRRLVADRDTPGTGAVALGVVSHSAGIGPETALLMFCHSVAVGMLGAAQRLLPLTHSQVQQILHSLHEPVADLASDLSARHWRDMTSFTPEADIAAMLHEHDEVRMFAS